MRMPSLVKVLTFGFRKSFLVKDELRAFSVIDQFECGHRIKACAPTRRAPRLNKSLIGHEFYVPSHDVTAKKQECAADIGADLRCLVSKLYIGNKMHDRVELHGRGECVVNALGTGVEKNLLMDGRGVMRKLRGAAAEISGASVAPTLRATASPDPIDVKYPTASRRLMPWKFIRLLLRQDVGQAQSYLMPLAILNNPFD